ncbi:MAG: class I SAM-dependent methyltransferase [Rhodospirillales bacterium]|nr:class I SAM-dependent methyltransferase [Rhodospirillales bacterium]
MKTVEHTSCRLCHAEEMETLHSLGDLYVSNFVDEADINSGTKAPLELCICNSCSLIQLRHTAPMELMYARHYWYRSGVTDFMRAALRNVTEEIEEMVPLSAGDIVLDIGANDGTLLQTYSVEGLETVGCEPADNLVDELRTKARHVIHDFWDIEAFEKTVSGKAKVITALGMFYDLEDPNQFIADARKALSEDGIFVAQLMCLASMLEKNDLGNICHEHLEYYSLDSLKYLFETNGLEMFKIEENNVNGGSYRIYARHLKGTGIDYDEHFSTDDLRAFISRIKDNKQKCVDFVESEVAKGKTVYVYGASTKGNTILQYYGLDASLITAASERSPEKWGKYTVGTGIPIISEDDARAAQPDYFLVLPWAFFDEFYEREAEWREQGGKFIVPLPDFKVVS